MNIKNLIMTFSGTVIRIAVLILAVVFIMSIGEKAYDFGFRLFAEEPMTSEPGVDISFTLTDDMDDSEIADSLVEKGLIRDALLFRIQKKLSSSEGDFRAGTYTLNTSFSIEEIINILKGLNKDGSEPEGYENSEKIDVTDDATGLETGGVLSEESGYSEGDAFEGEGQSEDNSFEGEGDEESAIED